MKRISFILLMFFSINFLQAQYFNTKSDDLNIIKNAVILVAFEEIDPKKIEKNKDDTLWIADYQNKMVQRNEILQNVIQKYWTYNNIIEYKSMSAADSMMEIEKEKYVKICFGNYKDIDDNDYNDKKNDVANDDLNNSNVAYSLPKSEVNIRTIEIITRKSYIQKYLLARAYLPEVNPTYADAVYGIQLMQYYFKYLESNEKNNIYKFYKDIANRCCKLKNKILLFNQELIDAGITEDSIESVYPYKFKIADLNEIDSAIINRDTNYAYIQIVNTPGEAGTEVRFSINNAEDGDVLYNEGIRVAYHAYMANVKARSKDIKLEDIQKMVNYLIKYSTCK
jgi:hypothetical protein